MRRESSPRCWGRGRSVEIAESMVLTHAGMKDGKFIAGRADMQRGKQTVILASGLAAISLAAWQLTTSHAQQGTPARNRFEFAVVESFDARYLGDTPGHSGHAKLGPGRLGVALGDPVFRGDRKIGKISGLTWDRSKESLEIEFDPEPYELDDRGHPINSNRVVVGETVWIARRCRRRGRPCWRAPR